MALFAIGDLHLSLGTDKPMDIFQGWDNYVALLKQYWNQEVSEQDTVVIVGDISWAMNLEQAQADFSFIHQLKGHKILMKGNHDYWFSTKTKVEQYFVDHGFYTMRLLYNNSYVYQDYVLCGTRGWINEPGQAFDQKILNREVGRLRLSLEHGKRTEKQPIAFLHYPPLYANSTCDDILDVLTEYDVKRCFYGHIHGSAAQYAVNGERDGISFHLVAGDYVGFRPVRIL